MRASSFVLGFAVPVLLVGLVGCEKANAFEQPPGPFDLTFSGDASFQGAHGGQGIEVAVVNRETGEVIDMASGTVSATADPSFQFSFPDALQRGEHYFIDYWIDSNFGGGTAGTCDPPATDHQWRNELPRETDPNGVVANAIMPDVHRPTETESVCDTFS